MPVGSPIPLAPDRPSVIERMNEQLRETQRRGEARFRDNAPLYAQRLRELADALAKLVDDIPTGSLQGAYRAADALSEAEKKVEKAVGIVARESGVDVPAAVRPQRAGNDKAAPRTRAEARMEKAWCDEHGVGYPEEPYT